MPTRKRPIRTSATADLPVVAYVRVATDEQASSGAGIVEQRSAIVAECERRGWHLLGVFEDAGASDKTLAHRPALELALAELESGAASALVVAKLDRLSRSLLDFASLMERSREEGWSLVVLDLGVDSTTPNGQIMANVMASFAQFERRLIGLRTREALAEKRRSGVRLGRPRSLSNEVRDRIGTMRQQGQTLSQIAASLNRDQTATAHGGRWHATTIRRLLLGSTS